MKWNVHMSGKCQEKWTSGHQNNFTVTLGANSMFCFWLLWVGLAWWPRLCFVFLNIILYNIILSSFLIFLHHHNFELSCNLDVTSLMPFSLLIKSQWSHFSVWSLICSQVYINLLLKNTLHFIQRTSALTRIWTNCDKRQCVCAGCECIAHYLRYFPKALVWR